LIVTAGYDQGHDKNLNYESIYFKKMMIIIDVNINHHVNIPQDF